MILWFKNVDIWDSGKLNKLEIEGQVLLYWFVLIASHLYIYASVSYFKCFLYYLFYFLFKHSNHELEYLVNSNVGRVCFVRNENISSLLLQMKC